MTIKDLARRMMSYYALPIPKRDRTMKIMLPPRIAPATSTDCGCHMIVKRYWRAAHENQCTKIVVQTGSHVHPFDTIDLMRTHARELGWWPVRPERFAGRVPRFRATRALEAVGDRFEQRSWDAMIPSARLTQAPVSGDPGGKETDNGLEH